MYHEFSSKYYCAPYVPNHDKISTLSLFTSSLANGGAASGGAVGTLPKYYAVSVCYAWELTNNFLSLDILDTSLPPISII